jgi:hypothetical protein
VPDRVAEEGRDPAEGHPPDVAALRDLLRRLDLPAPGAGRTAERHRALFDLARDHPLHVARLAEAHADAVAILAEAGRRPRPGAVYGVWASRGTLALDRRDATAALTGEKPFCSGLGIVSRALVTATVDGGSEEVLVDVDLAPATTLATDPSGWGTPALAGAATGTLRLQDHRIAAADQVGDPGWYLRRPGFWHGALGPAACWAGGVAGLAAVTEAMAGEDPHRLAHLGGVRADVWALRAVLDRAGAEIDAAPDDVVAGEHRARSARHVVERLCTDVLDRVGRALGPRPYVADAAVAQRVADVHLYLRQDHAERDLAALGRLPQLGTGASRTG